MRILFVVFLCSCIHTAKENQSNLLAEVEDSNEDEHSWSCPEILTIEEIGVVQSTELSEISGLSASKSIQQKLWVHNDSGDSCD